MGALTNEGGLNGKDLGKIDIFPSFSLVDIATPLDSATIDRISRARVAGKSLRIQVDQGAPQGARAPRAGGSAPRSGGYSGHGPAGRYDERPERGGERKAPRYRTGER